MVALAALAALSAGPSEAADPEAGRKKAEPCAACHGAEGHSTNPMVPSLAGQPAFYIHWQLNLYRDKRREDPQMAPFAANLSTSDMADLAAYYAALTPRARPAVPASAEITSAGRRLAQLHHCSSCHAPVLPSPRYVPFITGLPYEYLLKQLRGFKDRTRGELETIMSAATQPLSDEDIEILARYLAGLQPLAQP